MSVYLCMNEVSETMEAFHGNYDKGIMELWQLWQLWHGLQDNADPTFPQGIDLERRTDLKF